MLKLTKNQLYKSIKYKKIKEVIGMPMDTNALHKFINGTTSTGKTNTIIEIS